MLKTFLDSWDTILNSAQKKKNIMPSGRFLLRQEDSEYRRNTSGMWKGERREEGPRGESWECEVRADIRDKKKAVVEEGWDCSRAWKGERFVGVGLVA